MGLKRLAVVLACLLVGGDARAQRALTLDEVVAAAVERDPTLVQAARDAEAADADVTAALGRYDPVLALRGGWNRTRRSDVRQEFSTLFLTRNDGWNLETSLSATSPTGTTVDLSAGVTRAAFGTNYRPFGETGALDPSNFFSERTARTWTPVFRLALAQELLRGVLPSYNLDALKAARARRSIEELRLEAARQRTIADVSTAYWNWVHLVRLAEIAHQSVAVAEEALRVGISKVAEGQLAPVERTRLEAALVQAQASAMDADHAAAQAADALLVRLGETPGQPVVPVTPVGDVRPGSFDPEAEVRLALERSPDLAIVRKQYEEAERALRAAKHGLLPSLTANVEAQYAGSVPDGLAGEVGFGDVVVPSITLGGVLSVPLGNRAAVGAVRRAEAEVARAASVLRETEARLRAEVLQQVRVLQAARQRVALADANERLARETLAAEEALLAAGRALHKDVLEARAELDRALGEATRARTEYRNAEIELRRLQAALAP